MPINHAVCKRYKDTWAAPGSQLFAALEAGDSKKAEAIYKECEAVNDRLVREGRRKTILDSVLPLGIPVVKNHYSIIRTDCV